jgi:lysozyme
MNMKTSKRGLSLIRHFEGFSPVPYCCPAGKLTIGYGHVIVAGEEFQASGISQKIAENILKQDVSMLEEAMAKFITANLSQNQFDALTSFIYNIGIKAFEKSTLLRLLNEGKSEEAAAEFFKWIYAGKVAQTGLIRRRAAEKQLFMEK